MHESYNHVTLQNDICIIRLPSAVSGNGIDTIRLPSRSMAGETFEGVAAISSGWGSHSNCKLSFLPKIIYLFGQNINFA
jgi:Trypsin